MTKMNRRGYLALMGAAAGATAVANFLPPDQGENRAIRRYSAPRRDGLLRSRFSDGAFVTTLAL